MAKATVTYCDHEGCHSTDTVVLTVAYGRGVDRPWEVDLCRNHYNELFTDLLPKGRPARVSNVRPQHRLVKTEITEKNL